MGGSNNRFRGRRVLAVLGAVTLGLVGAVGAAAPASAAPGNIDFGATGTILIHKHEHGASAQGKPSGGNLDSPGVAGVRFTAYPITSLPLNAAASWTALRTLVVPATACDGPTLGVHTFGAGVTSPLTDSSGRADIVNLPVAAYLLCETTSPSTAMDKAQPFVVTIPYPNESGTATESWLYNVNVYPKNTVATVSKTVSPQGSLGLGATASFPVTTDIPKIADDASFLHYWVQDPMDGRLTGATASVKLQSTGDDVPNAGNVNYTVTTSASNLVSVAFTAAGLTWLESHGGDRLITTFTGVVSSLGTGATAGVFNNTAYFGTKTGVQPEPPTTPQAPPSDPTTTPGIIKSDPVVTQNWGDLAVHKVDAGSQSTGIQGAKFQVFAAAAPYAAACNSTAVNGSAISVNGENTFTSDENGLLHITGLFVSDSKNATVDSGYRCYVLKEIEAPAGFILPTDGSEFRAVTVKTGITNTSTAYDDIITNTREQGVVLPMTGSNGIVVLSVAGLALIAAGAVLALLARKRSRQTA